MERAIANFRQNLQAAALTLELPALWRWWVAELAPLVPAAPRAAVQRRRLRPVLAFSDDAAMLWDLRARDGALAFAEVARISLVGDAAAIAHAGRAAIEALPMRVYGGGTSIAKVIVALPPSQILRKQIVLPAAVEENLLQALTYDLDRHTPFRADQLYFDAVVIGRDMAKKEIRVDWAAALKTVVDQTRRQAQSWGATVVGVAPEVVAPGSTAASGSAAWSKLNLLPHAERPDTAWWRRWQFWLPLCLLAVAALVAVALPLWQKRDFVLEHAQATEQARAQATASDALRQQLDQATGDYNFALGKKYAFPSTVQLLDDITRLLPDDTWLTQLEIKSVAKGKEPAHREMMLRGESANAGRLISALEDSKLFEQAAPRSPTTKIQPGPGEVFDLGTQVIPSPTPQVVALASTSPARVSTPATTNTATDTGAPASASGATTTSTSGATAPSTPGATTASTPGAKTAITPGATTAPTPGARTATTPGATPASVPGSTTGSAPAANSAATPRSPPAMSRSRPAPAPASADDDEESPSATEQVLPQRVAPAPGSLQPPPAATVPGSPAAGSPAPAPSVAPKANPGSSTGGRKS